MLKQKELWVVVLGLTLLMLSGCGPEAKQDVDKADTAIKTDAAAASKSISDATANTKKALSNDETSATVKQALLTAKDLTTTNLLVDTNGKKVTLHGSVPTGDQKKRAEQIAKTQLGSGYTVVDQLKVGSGS
jgi:osmotically-inducible protein OsmY